MSAQHTPLPWEVRFPLSTAARCPVYIVAADRVIADIRGGATLGDLQEAQHNARRIVQCVNAHDDLVEASENLLAQLDRIGMTREEDPLMDAMRAAIAKAVQP